MAEKLDIDLNVNEIEAAHRLPSRIANKSRIIVQLSSCKKRDLFLYKKRTVLSSNILTGGSSQVGENRVFINENLNPFYKELLWRAKGVAKDLGYKFVWLSRGKILVKKSEETKQVIKINSFLDLDKIK